MNSPNPFHANVYQILPSVLPGQTVQSLLEHALTAARRPEVAAGDTQVPGTPAVYADPRTELLLARLTPVVEAEAGVAVYPTYSYFRVYKKGDKLKKHKDRPSCEISLSLSLGYDPDQPWPLWVEGNSRATALRMNTKEPRSRIGVKSSKATMLPKSSYTMLISRAPTESEDSTNVRPL